MFHFAWFCASMNETMSCSVCLLSGQDVACMWLLSLCAPKLTWIGNIGCISWLHQLGVLADKCLCPRHIMMLDWANPCVSDDIPVAANKGKKALSTPTKKKTKSKRCGNSTQSLHTPTKLASPILLEVSEEHQVSDSCQGEELNCGVEEVVLTWNVTNASDSGKKKTSRRPSEWSRFLKSKLSTAGGATGQRGSFFKAALPVIAQEWAERKAQKASASVGQPDGSPQLAPQCAGQLVIEGDGELV